MPPVSRHHGITIAAVGIPGLRNYGIPVWIAAAGEKNVD